MSGKRKFIICIYMMLLCQIVLSQSVNVPLEHWVYDFIDRLQTRGFIRRLNYHSRPYSRMDVASILAEVQEKIEKKKIKLSSSEFALYKQFKGEYIEELKALNIEVDNTDSEKHFIRWDEGDYQLRADLYFDEKIEIKTGDQYSKKEKTSHTSFGGFMRGNIKNSFGYYLFVQNTLIRGADITDETFDPSRGAPITISGDNVFSDDADDYLVWNMPGFEMEFGRDRVQWGPGYRGSLLISRTNPRFELLKMAVQSRRFRFIHFHGKLHSGFASKYIVAHRLEVNVFPWLMVAGTEVVIYGKRNVEPLYLIPIMPLHVAEHHLGDADNNMMGFELTAYPKMGHKCYFELMLDDFSTTENPFTYYGNKFAFLSGWHWVSPFGFSDLDTRIEYTRIEPFVYTHGHPINIYKNYDQSIGHWLGPNSDNLYFRAHYLLSRDLNLAFITERIRHGEGDIDVPHDITMGSEKKFLSGTVETIWSWGLVCTYQIMRDMFASAQCYNQYIDNLNLQAGTHARNYHFSFNLSINY